MYWCRCCRKEFATRKARAQHWKDVSSHPYCHMCSKHFRGEGMLKQHILALHSESYCQKCNLLFDTTSGLRRHHSQSVDHHHCAECEIDFDTASDLHHHKMSSTHNEQDIGCELRQCHESFVSQAALMLHWESGSCKSGIDCNDVQMLALVHDRHRTISCRMNQATLPISTATAGKWYTGSMYECRNCIKTFQSQYEIVKHFNIIHADKLFVCPNDDCDARFALLSGVTQHVLSNKCGAADVDEVTMKLLVELPIKISVNWTTIQQYHAMGIRQPYTTL